MGKSLMGGFLRANEMAFARLPAQASAMRAVRSYGKLLHSLVQITRSRNIEVGTFFMRNRPQIDLALRLIDRRSDKAELKILVLGCSTGAEVYSLARSIRSQRPGLRLAITAVDLSARVIEFARRGIYPRASSGLVPENVFSRLREPEIRDLFEVCGDSLRVKDSHREGISWLVASANDRKLRDSARPYDLVFANNFLCHLRPREADECLRSIVQLAEGAYLFVSGVDLDVRARVIEDLGLTPVTESIEEIHAGDPSLLKDWPFRYWGLEPFDASIPDWIKRYCSVFYVPSKDSGDSRPMLA